MIIGTRVECSKKFILYHKQHLPKESIAVGDHSVVAAPGSTHMALSHPIFVTVVEIVHAPADCLALCWPDIRNGRQVNLILAIAFEILPRAKIGVMRLHERSAQHERPLVVATCVLVEPAL